MPPRKPPTQEDLIQALLARTPLSERPVLWSSAFTAIKQGFQTTNSKTTEWLRDMVEMETGRPLELLDVGAFGHVAAVHRARGRWARKGAEDSAWVSDPLSVLGYPEEDTHNLYIDAEGSFRSKPTERNRAGSHYFVALRQVLDNYAGQAHTARIANAEARAEAIARQRAEVERRHGNAPDYFRGLLAAAGVPNDGRRQFRLRLWDPDRDRDVGVRTTVYLELDDGEIDLVARFLADKGVQPITASEYRKTRKR